MRNLQDCKLHQKINNLRRSQQLTTSVVLARKLHAYRIFNSRSQLEGEFSFCIGYIYQWYSRSSINNIKSMQRFFKDPLETIQSYLSFPFQSKIEHSSCLYSLFQLFHLGGLWILRLEKFPAIVTSWLRMVKIILLIQLGSTIFYKCIVPVLVLYVFFVQLFLFYFIVVRRMGAFQTQNGVVDYCIQRGEKEKAHNG